MSFPSELLTESFRGRTPPATWAEAADALLSAPSGSGVVAREIEPLLAAMATAADAGRAALFTSEQLKLIPGWVELLPLVSRAFHESMRGQRTAGPALIAKMAGIADLA
jgi:hypothetical protein